MAAPEPVPDAGTDGRTGPAVEYAFDALSAASPEGWRVELIEGEIHVVPPANGERRTRRDRVRGVGSSDGTPQGQRAAHIHRDRSLRPRRSATGKVVPDLVVAPKASFGDHAEYHDPAPVLLVGEVTSRSTGRQDRGPKLRGYARAGIPCYLLIDRETGEVVVYSEPSGESYTRQDAAALSKTVALPEPLGFELDTGEF